MVSGMRAWTTDIKTHIDMKTQDTLLRHANQKTSHGMHKVSVSIWHIILHSPVPVLLVVRTSVFPQYISTWFYSMFWQTTYCHVAVVLTGVVGCGYRYSCTLLTVSTRWRQVVCFMSHLLCPRRNSTCYPVNCGIFVWHIPAIIWVLLLFQLKWSY